MYSIKIFTEIIKGISQKKSLCRILQNYETKKLSLSGNIIEFGAEPSSTKNFSSLINNKSINKIYFSDKHISKKGVIKADLNKNINIKKNFFDNVFLFNVLEHIFDIKNAKKQISKIIKKNGSLIGSTPFLYRFHAAPSDYLRFTKPYLIQLFKTEYKIKSFSLSMNFVFKFPIIFFFLITSNVTSLSSGIGNG